MVNPLELLANESRNRQRAADHDRAVASLRRRHVDVPTEVPGSDAIFLVLRRMRMPLIIVVSIFAFCSAGLSLMPGTDAQGNPYRLSLFDAFYVMSYTATTIGFGEVPYPFSYAQRLWVTLSIYLTVTGWAYAVSALFALLQDRGFRAAISAQRFRRKVAAIKEPFWIVAGYGDSGRGVCAKLDRLGRNFVVLDHQQARVDKLAIDQLTVDAPAFDGDVGNPALLGLAGLDRPNCEGVLALTSDEANLAVVMAVNLLRPGATVIARADSRDAARRMENFAPDAVINPFDRYGAYLTASLQRPAAFQLTQWLISADGSPLGQRLHGLDAGPWIVARDDHFGDEVAADLERAGLSVVLVDPTQGDPDVTGASGLVAGSSNDVLNLALAAHARLSNPDIFLSVRQRSDRQAATMQAFDADSLFVPSDLVARETVARIIAPTYWDFVEHLFTDVDEDEAERLLAAIHQRVGDGSPTASGVHLDAVEAPSVRRWLAADREMTLRDLLRDPDDRATPLPVFCLSLLREGKTIHAPGEETMLQIDDELVVAGTPEALRCLDHVLTDDVTVEHLVTGLDVPATALFRWLGRTRKRTA